MEDMVEKRNSNVSDAVVIGTGPAALRFYQKLNKKKRQRYHIIGFIGDENAELPAPRLCGMEELASCLLNVKADEIIIATEADQVYLVPDIISICEGRGLRYTISSAEQFPGPAPQLNQSGSVTGHRTSKRSKLNSTFWRFTKRTFDILVSAILILLTLPIMLLIAIGVRFSGKGTVLIRERIIGRRRKPFIMLKFRSTEAVPEEGSAEDFLDEDDVSGKGVSEEDASEEGVSEEDVSGEASSDGKSSVSSFRLWIRNTKLDLLPRLFNILTGAMSFVGPHPEPREFIRKYRNSLPGFMQRYRMRPGLIGWARLIGQRRDDAIPEEERIRYDLWYVANWSPRLDLSIIRKTLFDKKTYSEAAEERKKIEEARSKAEEERKAAEEARKAAEEERKAAEEARRAAEEERKAAEEARRAEEEERRIAEKAERPIPETVPEAIAAANSVITKKVLSRGEVVLAVAGYFGRPLMMLLAVLVMLYYLCYRVDPFVSLTMYVPLEVVSLILFITAAVLSIKKRTAITIILFCNFLWMVLTRILHDDLTVTPHGVCYFAAMFFAFYSCGVLLKNRQREYMMDLVAVVIGGVLLLWAVIGFATALSGQSVRGFEMIRLLAERTPALMTFISFYGTHRNISSTYFVIMMGIAIYQYAHHRTLFWKIMAILFVPLAYIMVAIQHSRSNYMAAAIVLTSAVVSLFLDRCARKGRQVHPVLVLAGGTLCVFLFLIGFYKCNGLMEVLGIKFRELWDVIADIWGLPKFNYGGKFTDPRNLSMEITTLNRRTDIWRNAIPVLKSHPEILTIGRPENLIMETINERVLWRKEPHMHNALLQQRMTVGVPGALLYVAMCGIICKNIFVSLFRTRQRETAGSRVLSGILLAMFAYSILEPLLSPKIPLSSLLFCLIAGCLEGEQTMVGKRIKKESMEESVSYTEIVSTEFDGGQQEALSGQ